MNKKSLLICLLLFFSLLSVSSFIEEVKAGTNTFGYTSTGTTSLDIRNKIAGSVFTCPANGTTVSITAYLTPHASGYSGNVKAAVYLHSDSSLVDNSTEILVTTEGWKTFTLNGELLTEGEGYVLVVWAEDYANGVYLDVHAGDTNQYHVDEENYGVNWADPASFVHDSYEASIYITYTEAGEFNYRFHGLFDENTGYLKDVSERAVNVTSYWNDGTASETFEVNGTDYKYFDSSPQYFVFDLGGVNREYWLSIQEGNATTVDIYIFTDSLTNYTLTFRDWTGALSTYSWVSVMRYINGTGVVVDKRKVDEQNKVVMAMQLGKTYVVQVEAVAGTTYTWGDLTMTSDTTVDLVVKGLTFPSDVILTYRYVRVYGYRENYNISCDSIVHVYEDTKLNTDSVNVSIYDGDDTLVHSYLYSSTNNFTYTWSEAVNTTSYYSVVTITHGDYGTLIFDQSFLRGYEDSPFDLDFLGSLPGGVAISTLLPMGILLVTTLGFSALTAGIGGIIVVALAGIMTTIGWVSLDTNLLVFTGILAILYAVLKNYKRVTVR